MNAKILTILAVLILSGCQIQQKAANWSQRKALNRSPFREYDAEIIRAVERRWDDLLEKQQHFGDRTGKVVLRFHLNSDGTVTDITPLKVTVGDLPENLCERAIRESAPYAHWPSDMRRLVGADYRVVTFTFYYDK